MRELQIPLLLWISAAFVLHLAGTGGVVGVTLVEEKARIERESIREMVGEARRELGVVELDLEGTGIGEPVEPEPEPEAPESLWAFTVRLLTAEPTEAEVEPAGAPEELDPYKAFIANLLAKRVEPTPAEEPKPEPPKPEEKAKEQAKAEPEPPKPEKKVEEPPTPKKEKPLDAVVLKDKRIAIDQVVKDKNQQNPDAQRLAENANKVDQEEQSRIRSQDHKAENPSPGTNQAGPSDQIGNADKERVGSLEDRAGDPERAPGESSPSNTDSAHRKPQAAAVAAAAMRSGGRGDPSRSPGARGQGSERPSPAMPGLTGGGGPASPDVHEGPAGSWNINPSRMAGTGAGSGSGKATAPVAGVIPFGPRSFGFGMLGAPGGPPNLSWDGLEKAVGEEQLRQERAAVGAAIRAQHKGRFDTGKFARFLPDIENYDPTVKIGNQTSLNAAQSAFAKYLHDVHNRIHPIFGDEFLMSLEGLPAGHPLRDEKMVAHIEIILSQADGRIVRMGITQNSGSTVFDAAALDAIDRAGPFGKAPEAIASSDGMVYLHWEFHRNLFDACSTRNAHPFIVKDPKPVVPNVPPRKPGKKTKKPAEENTGPLVPLRKK